MKFKQRILLIFVYLFVILQIYIKFEFAGANSVGKLGYYDYNDSNASDKKRGKFRKDPSIELNFMKYFLNVNKEMELIKKQNNTSINTPFMDFLHVPLSQRTIPKSEEVCSSIQLMSFWKLYNDVFDLVESEFNNILDLELVQKKASEELYENSLILTQSDEIKQDISEELKKIKNETSSTNIINEHRNLMEDHVKPQKNATKTNKKPNKFKDSYINKKKQTKNYKKIKTFEFGLHRYFNLN
ncbi:signal peptide-containing protein [Cryptosporidium hominis]